MRHRAPIAAVMLVLMALYSAACLLAPVWSRRAGLDFWNHARMAAWARAEGARDRDLDAEIDQQRRREAAFNQTAVDVCEYRLCVRDAIGDLTALAECDPRWWRALRNQYQFRGLPLSAPDREAAALLLRSRIEFFLTQAEKSGDPERASLLAERLASFDEESRKLDEEVAIVGTKP